MKKFCPKCGKTITKGKFCQDCKEIELEYKPIKIKICPSKKYFFQGKWSPFENLNELTQKLVNQNFKQKVIVNQGLEKYELLDKPGIKKDFEITIIHEEYEYPLNIYVETTYSPGVAKLGSQYFEGILQLRNTNKDIINFTNNYMTKNEVYANDTQEINDGIDYYFVHKKKIQTTANALIKEFGGYLDINEQLFSRNHQTSKDIYRINAKLTFPKFQKNDVITYNDQVIYITNLSKEISGLNLEKEKKETLQFNQKTEQEFNILIKQKTQIITTTPTITILDKNYQPKNANNPLKIKNYKIGKNAWFVEHKQKYYLVKN